MFNRHAHQFVAFCLSVVVTVSVMAGVNTMAFVEHGPEAMAQAPAASAPEV